jgi:tetratricopeptide (TPR) repeat protein
MTDEDRPAWVNPRLVRPHGWSPKLHVDPATMSDQARAMHVVGPLSVFMGEAHRAENFYHFYTNSQSVNWGVPPSVWTPWTGEATTRSATVAQSLEQSTPYITDDKLLEVCQGMVEQTQLLEDLNGQLGRALAIFLGLSAPKTEEDFQELRQQVDDYRSTHGPAWASRAEIGPLIAQLKDIFVELTSLEFEFHGRLRPFYEHLAPADEEFGDQRAHDLVDQAIEEPDADRAIRLLQKALRYGETGIQASKAYMELAARYSDLGDTERAIEHYTKSIEASQIPNAMTLYWRGELYYQREEWNKARSDFERAVAIGLFSPEYEQAQECLSKLRAGESGE